MENSDILATIETMVFFMELKGENPFKVRAFANAARVLEDKDIAKLFQNGELQDVPGVGKGILAFIGDCIQHGKPKDLAEISKDFPETILELRSVRGLGPKKIKTLFEELQIASLAELEYACQENRLIELKGFGEKTQKNFLEALQFLKQSRSRLLLAQVLHQAQDLLALVRKTAGVEQAELVGELRRKCETVAKIEILVQGAEKTAAAKLKSLAEKHELGLPVEFHFVSEAWGSALVKYTGSTEHLEKLKGLAGIKLETEAAVYKKLGFALPAPELREAWSGPKDWEKSEQLVTAQDVRGIFHVHTKASDGANTLEEMVEAAEKLGYEYIGISDHSESAVYAHGLGADRILAQRKEIDKLQERFPKIKIFHGIEADIHGDGRLDYSDKVLKEFDFVIASIHGQMRMPCEEMTKRLCRALENPYCTWLGHITGRLLLGRPAYEFDWEKVLKAAEKSGTGIELNANPYRLDMDWQIMPAARAHKIPIGIFPDAHSIGGLKDVEYGIMAARKGGLSKKDVSNTLTRKEMEAWLAARR